MGRVMSFKPENIVAYKHKGKDEYTVILKYRNSTRIYIMNSEPLYSKEPINYYFGNKINLEGLQETHRLVKYDNLPVLVKKACYLRCKHKDESKALGYGL